MKSIVAGDGGIGRTIAATLTGRGMPPLAVLGMPETAEGHPPERFAGAQVLFEFSVGEAVLPNVRAALQAGVPAVVIGTTNWAADRPEVERLLERSAVPAVASPNFSIGVMLFARIVDEATRLFGPFPDYDPFLLEWHRRTKADRPSGTALELARRIIDRHPRKDHVAPLTAQGSPDPQALDVSVIRAGNHPGMHLVGFDAPGETLELRLTARDRSAYAAGALVAADWLLSARRSSGIHTFDEVLDSILATAARATATTA